jgi:hypothetical protein
MSSPDSSDSRFSTAPKPPRALTALFQTVREEMHLAEAALPPRPKRVDALWDKWGRFVDLFTTQEQQAHYGVREWHQDHQLLRHLKHILPEGERQIRSIWGQCGNTRWHRFNRMFSRFYHYSVPGILTAQNQPGVPLDFDQRISKPGELSPTARLLAAKKVAFELADRNILDSRLCLSCLVDVDRVPPLLMSDLGIISWERSRRMRGEDVLHEIKKPENLLQLKLIFDAAEGVEDNERVLIVRPASDALLQQYCSRLAASGHAELAQKLSIPEKAIGKVLVIGEEFSGTTALAKKNDKELIISPLKVAVFDSVYAAGRSASYAVSGYAEERAMLARAKSQIDYICGRVLKEWKRESTQEVKQSIKGELKSIIEALAPDFQKSTNTSKVEAFGVLCDIRESLERGVNPQAKAQQLLKINRSLEARKAEANIKNAYRSKDSGAIDSLIKEWEGAFRNLANTFESKAKFFNANSRLFLKGGHPRVIRDRLSLDLGPFDSMSARPFLTFANSLLRTQRDLERAIAQLDRGMTLKLLVKADIICRLQRVQRGLELIVAETGRTKAPNFSRLEQLATALEESLPPQTPLGRNAYKQVYPNYEQLHSRIASIRERLREDARRPMSAQERDEAFVELREDVKERFNIEAELENFQL